MNTKEKIRFILVFFVSYFLLLAIGVFIFGNFLVGLEEKIIFWLLQNRVNYEAFDFVVYCSGIVSISAYLGVVIALKTIKQKMSWTPILLSIIVLFLVNLLRIMVVMLSEKVGWHQQTHIISWFLMLFVVVWLIKITFQKQ